MFRPDPDMWLLNFHSGSDPRLLLAVGFYLLKVGSSGDVEATRWGGGRRIDRILVREDLAVTRSDHSTPYILGTL